MNKIISFIIAVAISLALAGCNSEESKPERQALPLPFEFISQEAVQSGEAIKQLKVLQGFLQSSLEEALCYDCFYGMNPIDAGKSDLHIPSKKNLLAAVELFDLKSKLDNYANSLALKYPEQSGYDFSYVSGVNGYGWDNNSVELQLRVMLHNKLLSYKLEGLYGDKKLNYTLDSDLNKISKVERSKILTREDLASILYAVSDNLTNAINFYFGVHRGRPSYPLEGSIAYEVAKLTAAQKAYYSACLLQDISEFSKKDLDMEDIIISKRLKLASRITQLKSKDPLFGVELKN